MVKHRFSTEVNREFAATLRARVRDYFKENNITENANMLMVRKSIVLLSVYFFTFGLILFGGIQNVLILFLLWMIVGAFKAFIGTAVMHDALHGSYSKNSWLGKFLEFSAVVIGADPMIWKIQHNGLHHTYTNIEHVDEDIQPRFFFRFTPHQTRRWFHKYQHIYATAIYSISTLIWVTIKDFLKLFAYRREGHVKPGAPFRNHLIGMIFRKGLYHMIFLVTPLLILDQSAGLTILMFIAMHLVAGFTLSMVFQPAHLLEDSEFILPEDGEEMIEQNWLVHQLLTTTNFATKNKIVGYFAGGLNFQIEHHLFPHICHIHYPKIAPIVKQTSEEFKIPYHEKKTMIGAIKGHFQLLKILGRQDKF